MNENKAESKGLSKLWKGLVALIKGSNLLVKTILLLAIMAILALGLGRLQKGFGNHHKISRTITQTITEIKKIDEFCTANYQEETVVSAKRKRTFGTDEIAIIVKGTVRVGFDLSEMETNILSDTSIVITLPKAKVLDVITNPSDCETFVESGRWTHKQVTKYKNLARQRIEKHALADNILKDAERNGKERIQLLFMGLGFKHVEILFEK